MKATLFIYIIPMVLIVLPILLQIRLINLRIERRIIIPVWFITLCMFLLELIIIPGALNISDYGLSIYYDEEAFLFNDSLTYIYLGAIAGFIIIPITGLLGGINYRNTK